MPACYKWNYLVIFKDHYEFTGTNDALKPFNLFTIIYSKGFCNYVITLIFGQYFFIFVAKHMLLCNKNKKKILAKDQCDYTIAKFLVVKYGASFISINILTFALKGAKSVTINVNKARRI